MIDSGFKYGNVSIKYEILNNGFKIYMGDNSEPTYHQYEPYIPDHSKTYEENALEMCKNIQKIYEDSIKSELDRPRSITVSEYDALRCDIDYLILLNDTTEE